MNIVVTGGTRGIGLATAVALSGSGEHRVIVVGRDSELLKHAASKAPGGNIIPLKYNLAGLMEERGKMLRIVSGIFTGLDILINNAGMLIAGDFAEADIEDARIMTEMNFLVPAALIRELLPLMHKGSHIVNISSMGGYQGSQKFRGLSYYSASKAALACLTECLALELSDYGISVNCIAPGSVDTEMFRRAFPGIKANLAPEEIAEFLSWFAISGNRFYNGKILPVSTSTP